MLQLLPLALTVGVAGPTATTTRFQDPPLTVAGELRPAPGVRMMLSGPRATTVWAASEWTLEFANGGSVGMPFGHAMLGQSGCAPGGAWVYFEIVRDGGSIRALTSCQYQPCHEGGGEM